MGERQQARERRSRPKDVAADKSCGGGPMHVQPYRRSAFLLQTNMIFCKVDGVVTWFSGSGLCALQQALELELKQKLLSAGVEQL
jgi:hypothetical protein